MSEYSDNYPTCTRTYATLRIYPGALAPDDVTNRLGVEPTDVQLTNARGRQLHGWFLSTEGLLTSLDIRGHIDWLLDRIYPARHELLALARGGARMDVSCYWLSTHGHGGPTLSPAQMMRLAELGLECWFDVYHAR